MKSRLSFLKSHDKLMQMNTAITTQGLSKSFDRTSGWRRALALFHHTTRLPAVQQVDLQIREGELFGLLGPNGAGKTTLVRMLAGLIAPDSGNAMVHHVPITHIYELKKTIGLVAGEERSFFWRLSGKDNLVFFARLHDMSERQIQTRIREVGSLLDITDYLERRVDTYSTGIKQRLGIARALLHNPPVLLLDEPGKSLDPASSDILQKLIQRICHDEGKTILLITHQMDEAEKLCDRIAIMHQGRITLTGDMQTIRKAINAPQVIELQAAHLPTAFMKTIQSHDNLVISQQVLHTGIHLRIIVPDHAAVPPSRILQDIIDAEISPSCLNLEPLGLDEIFAEYTQPASSCENGAKP